MSTLFLLGGVIAAVAIVAAIPRLPSSNLRGAAAVLAILALFVGFFFASFRYVGEDQVGIVVKNVGAKSLADGKIIATKGEMGPQARVLPPGWHAWLWPVLYKVEIQRVISVNEDEVGLLTALDGKPLPDGQVYAPEWGEDEFAQMVEDARYFLTDGGGFKGPQTSVLQPGWHRINTKLFKVEKAPVVNIRKAEAGVVKSNVGDVTDVTGDAEAKLVSEGERGIRRAPLGEGKYYLNTKAFEITSISTRERNVRYTKSARGASGEEQREITVRSSDGFTFPVDVRIEYEIRPQNAPLVVAEFLDDGENLITRLNSVVRSVFRNNAESVKALDYVQQRSIQETQSLAMIAEQMADDGVTVKAVRIGDVGDEQTLGALLKTQTDREIALQQQITFQEQQRAAEQRKALTHTEQEAEEEKRLATAQYQVQIAEEQKQQRIIGAEAEAESIRIQAIAQAQAFAAIAAEIGRQNAALIELLKVVGERGIQITPRVMVVGNGDGGSTSSAETTALIGTMLDTMMRQAESELPASAPGG